MEDLEKLRGVDSVADNIMKADRNFTKLKLEVENIDVTEQMETHNTADGRHQNIIGLLASLTTTEKSNLVLAINEVKEQSNEIATNMTNHKNEVVSEVISTTRDMSLDGAQVVTGFVRTPKRLDILAVIPNTKKFSNGHVSNTQRCILRTQEDTMTQLNVGIAMGDSNANVTSGAVTINLDKTVTIAWTKAGTGATGTAQIRIIAHYHGGA